MPKAPKVKVLALDKDPPAGHPMADAVREYRAARARWVDGGRVGQAPEVPSAPPREEATT